MVGSAWQRVRESAVRVADEITAVFPLKVILAARPTKQQWLCVPPAWDATTGSWSVAVSMLTSAGLGFVASHCFCSVIC